MSGTKKYSVCISLLSVMKAAEWALQRSFWMQGIIVVLGLGTGLAEAVLQLPSPVR